MKAKYDNPILNKLVEDINWQNAVIFSSEKSINNQKEVKEKLIEELRQNTFHVNIEYDIGFKFKKPNFFKKKKGYRCDSNESDELPDFNKEFIETQNQAEEYIDSAIKEINDLVGKEINIPLSGEIKDIINKVYIKSIIKKGDKIIYEN